MYNKYRKFNLYLKVKVYNYYISNKVYYYYLIIMYLSNVYFYM